MVAALVLTDSAAIPLLMVLAAVGPGWGLAVDALSYALAAASFALVRVQVAPPAPCPRPRA
jgi:hypothetical protein